MRLLACPFCGFEPSTNEDDCIYPVDHERTVYTLVCYEVGGGCGASVLGDSREDVISVWNTRKCKE